MKRQYIMLALVLGVLVWGCDSKDADEEKPEPTPLEELDDGLPPTGPFEGAHDPSQPVQADEFESTLVESFCLAYEHCRHDPLRALLFQSLAISSAMVANQEGDRNAGVAIRGILGRMEREDEVIANRQDCETVFGYAFQGGGLDGASIDSAVEAGTAVYHPERAAECMAQFGEPFDLCLEVRHITAEPDPEQVMESMARHGVDLEKHFAVCNQAIEGQLEAGDECRHGYECGQGLSCDVEYGDESGHCVELLDEAGMAPGGGGLLPGQPPAPGAGQAGDGEPKFKFGPEHQLGL